jgi:AraC-like DNA-binding protein
MADETSSGTAVQERSAAPAEFATDDPGAAHDWLGAVYADYRPEESNSRRDFSFRGIRAELGRGSVSRLHYSLSADNYIAPSDVLLVLRPTHGVMRVSTGGDEEVVATGTPVLFPPHQAVSALWADTDAGCVCLDAADVERVAVETTGVEAVALRFTGIRPMSPGRARQLNDAVGRLVRAVLRRPELAANPLISGQLTQLLAALVLASFPSTALASHPRIPPGSAAPAVVRRATDYIDAHPDREITLSETAAASGTGPRGLQAAFLRHRDTTPTEYARRVRMERAHQELRAADPAGPDTVPVVAARWGFADLDRFVGEYRQTYGRLPAETFRS